MSLPIPTSPPIPAPKSRNRPGFERQQTPTELSAPPGPNRRYLVFPDPIAFKYLEDDVSVRVVLRRGKLKGYELYLVEQWACSRKSPTLNIVTYTGDDTHTVIVGVLDVPQDESAWSPKLRAYFKAIQQHHARTKETKFGELMVTNLSSFPSALTVIPVPDGDIKNHRQEFIVNENLKRLGCLGRSGMTLSEPAAAAKVKFYQLYKTDDKVPFSQAVVELVKLSQTALFFFENLDLVYTDGLLCDVTEAAIGDWWTEFGNDYYNMEPTDGILGPSTVAALLGLLLGARNRLSYMGAPVSKDVFDIDATERGIVWFQKYQKLNRTRRLDRQTLHRLHTVTAKAALGESWGVQKAVKSTVTEIGGKRGELVLGMVGGRDKGGIGDAETLDLDKFISVASGERAKWLWLGKPKRTATENSERSMSEMSNAFFGKDEPNAQLKRNQVVPVEDEADSRRKEDALDNYPSTAPGSAVSVAESPGDKDALRRGMLKNVARDARSGFGRIKDAVYGGGGSLRGHAHRPSRDDAGDASFSAIPSGGMPGISTGPVLSGSPPPMARAFTWKNKPEQYLGSIKKNTESSPTLVGTSAVLQSTPLPSRPTTQAAEILGIQKEHRKHDALVAELQREQKEAPATDHSMGGSTADESDIRRSLINNAWQNVGEAPRKFRRRHTLHSLPSTDSAKICETRWPRRLSFSDGEEAVLRWEELTIMAEDENMEADAVIKLHRSMAEVSRGLYMRVLEMDRSLKPWVDSKINSVEAIGKGYGAQHDQLQALYYQYTEIYQQARQSSKGLISEEKNQLNEAIGNVGALANRLDYELNALMSRVEEVDDGVANFELQVRDLERRADELKAELETESWLHWAARKLTGIGTGPNITQAT